MEGECEGKPFVSVSGICQIARTKNLRYNDEMRLTPTERRLILFYFNLGARNRVTTAFSHEELATTLAIAKRSACRARKQLVEKGFLVKIAKARDHSPIVRCTDLVLHAGKPLSMGTHFPKLDLGLNLPPETVDQEKSKMGKVINIANAAKFSFDEKSIKKAIKPTKPVVFAHNFADSGIIALPKDWLEYAKKVAPDKDALATFEFFKNYWGVRASDPDDKLARKKDWRRTWQLWCLREGQRGSAAKKVATYARKPQHATIKQVNQNDFSVGWSK